METSRLPLSSSITGYTSLSSISSVSSDDLARGAQKAWDILHEEESLRRIATSCSNLDKILGGGISCRDITEIGGVPGIGKTHIGIQLSVNVQIPFEFGGLGGKALHIGSFMVECALQIAEACVEDINYAEVINIKQCISGCVIKPGDSWSHSFTNRVIVYWNGDERYAYIDKSPSLPLASASDTVTSRGLRNSSSSSKRVKMM